MDFDLPAPDTDATGMFRSMFGDPKPANLEQLREAIQEVSLDVETAYVWVDDSRQDAAPFTGWTAEISGETAPNTGGDAGTPVDLSTAGFPTLEALVDAMVEAGIPRGNIQNAE